MSKIGPRIDKGIGSSIPEALADDPIYTRGFTIGFTQGGPAWPRAAATSSSAPHTPPPPVIDSTEPQDDAGSLSGASPTY